MVAIDRNEWSQSSECADLVLFGSRGTYTHIGIYAGNDHFVHATHRGSPVMVTHLDSDYFRTRYMTAVRLSPR